MQLDDYELDGKSYDEMFTAEGKIRPEYLTLAKRLREMTHPEVEQRQKLADLLLRNQGVTFTVYSDNAGIEKVFPFDPIPRLITAEEWEHVERGLV